VFDLQWEVYSENLIILFLQFPIYLAGNVLNLVCTIPGCLNFAW